MDNQYTIIIVYVLLFAAMYFFLIRPNSKKRKAEQEMRNNITVGDLVTTIGGIMGKIVAIDDVDEAYVIETSSDRTKIKIKKWGISSVDTPKEPTDKEKELEQLKEKREKAKAEKKAAKEKAKADKQKKSYDE